MKALKMKKTPSALKWLAEKRAKSTGNFDPMFSLNDTCAKIRVGVAAMARKTWTTTKSRTKLQDKLDSFIAVHNGYRFC